MLAFYFDDLTLARKMSTKMNPSIEEGSSVMLAPRFLFQGLIAFELAASTRRRLHVWQGRGFLKRLEKMLKKGCVNVHHLVLLLRAEYISTPTENDLRHRWFEGDVRPFISFLHFFLANAN